MKNLSILLILLLIGDYSSAQELTSVQRMSLAPGTNISGDNFSYDPDIDGSGRYVIFTSAADNFAAPGFVSGKLNEHLYLRDKENGTTTQLDVTAGGMTGSPAGTYNSSIRTFDSSFDPHLSRDGKFAVFISQSSNISSDGQNETYGSWVYLKNLATGAIRRLPYATAGDNTKGETPTYLAINGDGSVVAITSIIGNIDNTSCAICGWQLSVYDTASDTTNVIDTGITGDKYNPGISDDGRFIVFENQAGGLQEPTYSYFYDRTLHQTTALNGGKSALNPAISGDGAFIAYADTSDISYRIRLLERETGKETLVSGGLNGEEPRGVSSFPSLSRDGRYIAFLSSADNLVDNDDNGLDDIFVYDRVNGKTTFVSVQSACTSSLPSSSIFNTGPPSISSDGRTIAFMVTERLISADILDAGGNVIEPPDQNSFDDVYAVKVDYDAVPTVFKKGVTPDSPFVSVNCGGTDARIQVELLEKTARTAKVKTPSIKKITEKVVIKKLSADGKKSIVKNLIAKRNVLAAPNLPPGNYSAELQAQARLNNGKTTKSKFSVPSIFTITN
jgi:Tol biopolymer transport system component